jgi:hypothetical protein
MINFFQFRSFAMLCKIVWYCIVFCYTGLVYAKHNYTRSVQQPDVTINGTKYIQFLFVDDQGQGFCGYRQAYDDPNRGELFSYAQPISSQTFSPGLQQLQNFIDRHETSVSQMKQRALQASPVVQRQQVDLLVFQGHISVQQALQGYQEIEFAQEINQARRLAADVLKKTKPKKQGRLAQWISSFFCSSNDKNEPVEPEQTIIVQEKSIEPAIKSTTRTTTSPPCLATSCPSQNKITMPKESVWGPIKVLSISRQTVKEMYEQTKDLVGQGLDHSDDFLQTMEKQEQALKKSLHAQPGVQTWNIKPLTAAILQAYDIDPKKFTLVNGLPIQHQLTEQLIDNLDNFAKIANAHGSNQNLRP